MLLICVSVFRLVPSSLCYYSFIINLEVRDGDTLEVPLLNMFILAIPSLLLFPYKVENCFFEVCEDLFWEFEEDYPSCHHRAFIQ